MFRVKHCRGHRVRRGTSFSECRILKLRASNMLVAVKWCPKTVQSDSLRWGNGKVSAFSMFPAFLKEISCIDTDMQQIADLPLASTGRNGAKNRAYSLVLVWGLTLHCVSWIPDIAGWNICVPTTQSTSVLISCQLKQYIEMYCPQETHEWLWGTHG